MKKILQKLCMLWCIYSGTAFCTPSLSNLLTKDWKETEDLVVFHYKAGDARSLNQLELYFFTASDCQEGFITDYHSPSFPKEKFTLHVNHDFALKGHETYLLAKNLMNNEAIDWVHSVLMRFRGTEDQIPRFLSGCADQGINCCIGIYPDHDQDIFHPIHPIPRQSFILFQEY